jgi:hypothetical protein
MSGERSTLLVLWAAMTGASCLGFDQELPAANALSACADGIDNDDDGLIDFPEDPGCESFDDPGEEDPLTARQCSDGIDNDGDGRIDFDRDHDGVFSATDDPGCDSAADDDETNVVLPQCADGIDNDSDGAVDLNDPECVNRNDDNEAIR